MGSACSYRPHLTTISVTERSNRTTLELSLARTLANDREVGPPLVNGESPIKLTKLHLLATTGGRAETRGARRPGLELLKVLQKSVVQKVLLDGLDSILQA